jgi:hypothetical protein
MSADWIFLFIKGLVGRQANRSFHPPCRKAGGKSGKGKLWEGHHKSALFTHTEEPDSFFFTVCFDAL